MISRVLWRRGASVRTIHGFRSGPVQKKTDLPVGSLTNWGTRRWYGKTRSSEGGNWQVASRKRLRLCSDLWPILSHLPHIFYFLTHTHTNIHQIRSNAVKKKKNLTTVSWQNPQKGNLSAVFWRTATVCSFTLVFAIIWCRLRCLFKVAFCPPPPLPPVAL